MILEGSRNKMMIICAKYGGAFVLLVALDVTPFRCYLHLFCCCLNTFDFLI